MSSNTDINSYDLSRNFWNWAFDNPEKVSPSRIALYLCAIHYRDYSGKECTLTPYVVMETSGIKSRSVYFSILNDLVEFGLLKPQGRNTYRFLLQ